ncbi:protein mono-ADP-ribosyltransferase PARP4 isoform X1 [Salmo trutta]|uniref:protein mono-ADP-ribosyltransferase PARP4 isoform X1 n=1 Tax=Salmo trutta TaxID=8032 RepID=UPI0011321DD3|nr:protein mono-ADP-ribosyltransferase PARP4 isoform X1 [Salmo trutta]XP_029558578.1 protein mono-ADP-ribosyltransferase PARP4 isoform X1 [Salmo trutta]
MALFDNCFVVLELKNLPYKEKKRLKLAITENGGSISYVINKQCTLVVTISMSSLSASRVRSIKKHQTPVVGVEYVSRCLEKGVLLPVEDYCLPPPPSTYLIPPRPASPLPSLSVLKGTSQPAEVQTQTVNAVNQAESAGNQERTYLGKFRVYTESDNDLPTYPTNFQVAKYSIFGKANSSTWSVLELQSGSTEGGQQQYRVVRYWREDHGAKSAAVQDKQVFLSMSEEAVEVYQTLRKELQVRGLTLRTTLPPEAPDLGSASLQQLLLEEKLSCSSLSQEVGVFVELLWAEALGCLDNVLKVPITSLSLNDVSRAEGLLLQVQRKLRARQGEGPDTEVASLMEEVYTLLPHKTDLSHLPLHTKLISSQLDLCQLIRDVLNVSEATLRSPIPSCLGKYRALRCSIERVPPGPELLYVTELLQDRQVQILQVLRVNRGVELQMFREDLGNVKPLLHSSSPSSFVGILSRGLLLPRVGVEHHGIERTDIGNLGGGIYFSDAMSTSLKYSKPSVTDGSRLLLVCDVALGRCTDLQKRDSSLTHSPEGYHSVHGVRHTPKKPSEFDNDEYVVYSPEQVRLQYVVQFRLEEDQLKDFQPTIDTSSTELPLPVSPSDLLSCGEAEEDLGSCKNPLEEVTAGLLDCSGQPLPLQAVHVRARLMDLLSQVIIFQTYTNQSTAPIEAKYVFPLDDSAAVCGFEAFINGKHVMGQVKEKQQARKEYKQAIERGHGAYLMDQDAPDVFTISVGNLPAGATVLIKVTFVTELVVMEGLINFSLPGSVAPWQQSSALNQRTQVTLEKVCVTNLDSQGEFSLDMSIEMPNEIINLHCLTHKVKIKRTDCKAVVRTCPGETLGPDGFLVCFSLAQIHLPRMWVEKHPDKDSQACMLVFYPDFEPCPTSSPMSGSSEVILLLDSSESMRGDALQNARRIALQLLNTMDHHSVRVNVISFGSDQKDAFLSANPLVEALQPAKKFIMSSPPVGGSTELWRPLRSLSLLPPSQGVRNLLLLSDGHVQNQALTLQLVRQHAQHSRLFTCGLSPTANRHMLRALAQAGGGAYEFFDTKTKHTWQEKVACQVKRIVSPGCSSVSVKWQQFNPSAPPPVQAPSQVHALFTDCHTLVYGFVPHCTQATLLGDLSGQNIETMVSTTELQKTRGTFLHKLTARAVIRDYEDGSLHTNEAEHEYQFSQGKKSVMKSFIIELSKEFSILSQFTSFVAIEERDSEQPDVGFTDVPKLISDEDVDFLPYLSWQEEEYERDGMDLGSHSMSNLLDGGPGRVLCRNICLEGMGMGEEHESLVQLQVDDESWEGSVNWNLRTKLFKQSATDDVPLGRRLNSSYLMGSMVLASPVTVSAATKPPDMTLKSEGAVTDEAMECFDDMVFGLLESEQYLCGSEIMHSEALTSFYSPTLHTITGSQCTPVTPYLATTMIVKTDFIPELSETIQSLPEIVRHAKSRQGDFRRADRHRKVCADPAFDTVETQKSLSVADVPRPPPSVLQLKSCDVADALPPPPASVVGSPGPPPPPASVLSSPGPPSRLQSFSYAVSGALPPPPPASVLSSPGPPPSRLQSFSAAVSDALPPPPPASVLSSPGPPPSRPQYIFAAVSDVLPSTSPASVLSSPGPPPSRLQSFSAAVSDALPPTPPASVLSSPGPPPSRLQSFSDTVSDSLPPPSALVSNEFRAIRHKMRGHPKPGVGAISHTATLPKLRAGKDLLLSKPREPYPVELCETSKMWTVDNSLSEDKDCGLVEMDHWQPSVVPASVPPSGFSFGGGRVGSQSSQHHGSLFGATANACYIPGLFEASSAGSLFGPTLPYLGSSGRSMGLSFEAPLTGGHLNSPLPTTHGFSLTHPLGASLGSSLFGSSLRTLQQHHVLPQAQKPLDIKKNIQKLGGDSERRGGLEFRKNTLDVVKWTEIFALQHSEGYWECSASLGSLLGVDVDYFANVFLKNRGISSLGVRAHADILRLVASLLVLQLMRVRRLEEGKLLLSLFRLDLDHSPPQPRCERWEAVRRAVDWVCWADREYPCVCSRLEFGWDWESSTRQLLGIDPPHALSPLILLGTTGGVRAQ